MKNAEKFTIGEEEKDSIISSFKKRKIELGKSEANLVYKDTSFEKAVLYIHGFADCFYNKDLALNYLANGYSFYALDLREHGRSIRDHGRKFYIGNIDRCFEEIDVAIYHIMKRHNTIVLNGFSMGGLIASIYMKRGFYKANIAALVLNSPLFQFKASPIENFFLRPLVLGIAKLFPKWRFNVKTANYKEFIERTELYLDLSVSKKHIQHDYIPLYMGWFKAMNDGINELEKGLGIQKPVLVLLSSKSSNINDSYKYDADLLLDVNELEKRSALLGDNVKVEKIHCAVHDIFMSKYAVREEAYRVLFDWLDKSVVIEK